MEALIEVADRWWSEAGNRRLPGESNGVKVFTVEFRDGCCYCGYTDAAVVDRLSALVLDRRGYTAGGFVREHAERVPYVVRCVASGLGRSDARQLRDLLVMLGPSRSAGTGRSVMESETCWVAKEDAGGESLPFSELGSFDLEELLGSGVKQELP